MADAQQQAQHVQLITAAQRRLYGYILTMLPSPEKADDVLQETNVVLWEKIDEFEPGTNFMAWARRVAYFQVKAYLKRHRPRGIIALDGPVLDAVARAAERESDRFEEHHHALRDCLEKLPDEDRNLIRMRYGDEYSVTEMATLCGRTAGALRQALYRIRGNLRRCVQNQVKPEAG